MPVRESFSKGLPVAILARGVAAVPGSPYVERAPVYNRFRLTTSAASMAVFTFALGVGVLPPVFWLAVASSTVVASHAAWRLARPNRSAWDEVVVDASMLVVFCVVAQPPVGALGVAVVYVGIPAVLFLDVVRAGLVLGSTFLSVAVVEWAMPGSSISRDGFVWVAVALGASVAPTAAWLTRELFETIAHRRGLDGAQFWARVSGLVVDTPAGLILEGFSEDITIERDRLQALRTTATALDVVATAVAVTDSTGLVTTWNREAERLFGVDGAEAIGRHVRELVVTADAEAAEVATAWVNEHGPWQGAIDVVHPSGEIFHTFCTVTWLFDADGTRSGTVLSWTDITDAIASREEVEFQANVLGQVRNAIVIADMTGVITHWNDAAEQTYGWTAAEAIGTHIDQILVPANHAGSYENCAAERMFDPVSEGEIVMLRKDGEPVYLLGSLSMIHRGGVPFGVVGVHTDVTALRAAEREARQKGDLARSVSDAALSATAVISFDGTIEDVNQAWRTFTMLNDGNPDSCGIGINYLEVCDRAGDDPSASAAAEGLRKVLAGVDPSFRLVYPCHAPGESRWFQMEAVPVPGVGAVVSHWNITAERRVRDQLNETIRAKDEFLTAIAHALRTPLTAVVGFSELLSSYETTPDEQADMIELIGEQSRELADLVDDLLASGRLDTGTIVYRNEPVDVAATIARVVTPHIVHNGIDVSIDVHPDLRVNADPTRMRQIIRNVVVNAIRHGAPPVHIAAQNGGTEVSISITDHGDGAPRYAEGRLFEPYEHLPAADGTPATLGLGLHVAQRLAHGMGGDLTYDRHEGTTTFTLTLPVAGDPSPTAP